MTAQIETTHHINFCLGIGEQSLRFNPREHKDELSLRHIPLPTVSLKGEVRSRKHTRLPSVSAELAVKQVNVDVTTDVLNQLLILQNTFIKVGHMRQLTLSSVWHAWCCESRVVSSHI